MPAVNIPGVGRVNFPDSMSAEEMQAAAQRLASGVGVDPNTGRRDQDLASIDALMTGTAEGSPLSPPTIADRLRNVRKETSLPLVGATMANIAAPGVGGLLLRGTLAASAGGAAGGAAAESDNPDATPGSIARAGLESGRDMALAELAGFGLGAVAKRAVAPNLKFLDPLKGVRQDLSRHAGEIAEGQTVRQLVETWRKLSQSQRAKLPKGTQAALEKLSRVGRFIRTPIGGEVAETLAVPAVAAMFGPHVALSLSLGKALLNPGPAARFLARDKLPSEATRAVASQATRLGLRGAAAEDEAASPAQQPAQKALPSRNMSLRALSDPEFWRRDIARRATDTAHGMNAGILGAPVDLMSTVMRPFGYNVPAQNVVGSSDWIGSLLGADRDSISYKAGLLGPTPDAMDFMRVMPGLLGTMRGAVRPGRGAKMLPTKTISSQHYIDDEIVAAKRAANDYKVIVSPEFEAGGERVRVILDGHHSLAAAKADGVEPEFIEATAQDTDKIGLLQSGNYEDFLEAAWMDGDYYDIQTGKSVW